MKATWMKVIATSMMMKKRKKTRRMRTKKKASTARKKKSLSSVMQILMSCNIIKTPLQTNNNRHSRDNNSNKQMYIQTP